MANVKRKVDSAKPVSKKVKGCGKIGKHKSSSSSKHVKTRSVIKTTNTSQSNEKVKSSQQCTNDKRKDMVLVVDSKLKRKIHIVKENFMNKNGQVMKKNKDNLMICNDILKKELMIYDNKEKSAVISLNINLNNNNTVSTQKFNTDEILENSARGTNTNGEKKKDKTKTRRNITKKYPRKKQIPKKGLFQCDYCQRQFDNKSSLRRHIYIHRDKKKFPCQCKKVFRRKLDLTSHITRQHPDWDQHFMCNICNKPFWLRDNLIVHMATHNDKETKFKCIYCKEKFFEQLDLIQHEKKHLINGLYNCMICEQSFDSRNKLSAHLRTHLRFKDFICQHCGKEFLCIGSLKQHLKITHVGSRLQCAVCKKYLKGHLKEHMLIHEKQRPHKCRDCGLRFAQATQLTVHQRSHTGARPYSCKICDQSFTHSNNLISHIRCHTGEKPFECALCPKTFNQSPHMTSHMRRIHGKLNPFRCKTCNKFFRLKSLLDNHAKGCKVEEKELSFEEKIEASVKVVEEEVVESSMSLSHMRFLLALLLTKIATTEKLEDLGFNNRLIDDLLVESLEDLGHTPCKDTTLSPIKRLKTNIEVLLNGTIEKEKMEKFKKDSKRTEDILELLTT